ncbi:MAG: putative baseplate assembly protein [Cyanobacteria bacterium P01_F01_bin.150]
MVKPAPKIDERTAADIVRQVEALLAVYVPDLVSDATSDADQTTSDTGAMEARRDRPSQGIQVALIHIFARFVELTIQRLNQVPRKNLLAFLNLLGASRQPPQPARVPLTFSLVKGSRVDGVVLAGTQVAAPPAPGEKDPIVFETERDLVVSAASLASIFVRDPRADRYGDYSQFGQLKPLSVQGSGPQPAELSPPNSVPFFQGDRPIDHILYLGHSQLLGSEDITDLDIIITLEKGLGDEGELAWEYWTGTSWEALPILPNQSNSNLLIPALENDPQPQTITIKVESSFPPIPLSNIDGHDNRWLRSRLLTPINRTGEAIAQKVRDSQLPSIQHIQLSVTLNRPVESGLLPEMGFANAVPLELNKPFFPFGEQPKLNDIFYLGHHQILAQDRGITPTLPEGMARAGASVDVQVTVDNPYLGQAPNRVRPDYDLALVWEIWNGTDWETVGNSAPPSWQSLIEIDPLPPIVTPLPADTAPNAPPANMITVQGSAKRGSTVTIQVNDGSSRLAAVDLEGRFSAAVPLNPRLNVITCELRSPQRPTEEQRTQKTWAVVFLETPEPTGQPTAQQPLVQLTVGYPDLPIKDDQVSLTIDAVGNQNTIRTWRITNGRTLSTDTRNISGDRAFPITLENLSLEVGWNDLLIEGLEGDVESDRLLAATTVRVSRQPNESYPATGLVDRTYSLRQSGTVTLPLPNIVQPTVINGQENYWLRVRIDKGDYGKPASYTLANPLNPAAGFTLRLETFRPPMLSAIKLGYQQTLTSPPEVILTDNNLTFQSFPKFTTPLPNASGNGTSTPSAFQPFSPTPESFPSLYLGFTLPANRATFANRPLSLFCQTATFAYGDGQQATLTGVDKTLLTATHLQVVWQYWNGQAWVPIIAQDGSQYFTRSGMIELLPPTDVAEQMQPDYMFGLSPRYWFRAQWRSGDYALEPYLQHLLLNTTIASQTITIRHEQLGSSDGSEHQRFHSTRSPIFSQQLEVRERELLPAEEQTQLEQEEGPNTISTVLDAVGNPTEIWVRWHQVPDFYSSGPRDRHYVLDHLTGEIQFGDGLNGLVPPIGRGNLRLSYQTGGGNRGNRPSNSIVQLKTTVPYVDKVTNIQAASGGAEAETLESVIERAPRQIRHRNRAVTVEDYEDLGRLASPAVARVKCVPLRNLKIDPVGDRQHPGTVSLIIVPTSADPKPIPSQELVQRVQDSLDKQRSPTAELVVVGPDYIKVEVTAEIALASLQGATQVEAHIHQALSSFLHPLTGGTVGTGWDFGRKPYKSDLYALLEAISGVDYVRTLVVNEIEERQDIRQTNRFLVYSGTHRISLRLET